MKKLTLFLAAFVALSCMQAHAATTPVTPAPSTAAPTPAAAAAAPSAQESKMKQCATAYHARKIEKSQYRAFMSACLKKGADPATVAIPAATATAKTAAAPAAAVTPVAAATQTDKMTSCNANAKTQNLTGTARKAFMKTCLSN
jgi:hypothetical protein